MRRALGEPLALVDHVLTHGASILIPELMALPNLEYSVLMTGDPPAIAHP